MSDAPKLPATIADLLAIPEDRRNHEVIDGELLEKEATSGRHGGAQLRLGSELAPYNRKPGGRFPGGWWFASETEVLFEDTQVFKPDLAGWRRERLTELPREVPTVVRPDWVCEILSSNRRRDLVHKKRVYHQHEVPHYWIIDPVAETLSINRWSRDGYVEVLIAERHERVRAEPFADIELQVGVLFGDEPDD
ncbi:MAG TPA: Uma2 family endonuclease [Kofleriaceae bacterium]